MHPGPMNRGVEIDGTLADDINRSVIQEQVEMGVAVRMAAMDLLCATTCAPGSVRPVMHETQWTNRASETRRDSPAAFHLDRARRSRCGSPTQAREPVIMAVAGDWLGGRRQAASGLEIVSHPLGGMPLSQYMAEAFMTSRRAACRLYGGAGPDRG